MPSRPLNLALLGTGRIASTQLAPAVTTARDVQLWSVLSRDGARAAEFASRHGAHAEAAAHTDLDALLRDPHLDGVVIATPDKLHAEQAIRAARAGKHVLVEKPMATSVEDAGTMVDACHQAGVVLAVAYHLRWHAGHRALANAVQQGKLGDLRHMRVQWTWPAPDASNWRANPEVGRWWSLAGVGTHCLDLIRWFMAPTCGDVVSVGSVIGRPVWQGPHDETAVVALRFTSGATAEFCSSVLFESPSRMEIYGSEDYGICTGTLGPHGKGSVATRGGNLSFSPVNPYVGEIEDLAGAVREGRRPAVDGREGLRNVELLVEIESKGEV